jgi:N-acetylneuraminic acid mutarotase
VSLAPVITPRQEVAVAAASGRLYLIGGLAGSAVLSSVEEYDPRTNRWRLVAPLPAGVHHAAAVTIGHHIYVIGGYRSPGFTPVSSVFRYDTTLDQWSAEAALPSPRGALAAAAIDGKIYAAGGAQTPTDLVVYDPSTGAWSSRAPMPTGREHHAAVSLGGRLYVAGGRLGGNTNAFERYDPDTDRWNELPQLPTARSGIAAAVLDGRIYVFGGEGNPLSFTGVFAENESYDPATNGWRTEPSMPEPRHGIGAATIDGRIHIPAGAPIQGFSISDVHDAFAGDPPPRRRLVRGNASAPGTPE